MGLIKKGLSMAVVFIMIIAVFTACTDTSSQTDTINKEDLNDQAKQAYSEVLLQYEDAAKLSWDEYGQQMDDFPLVCARAMMNYSGSGYLYYSYYDLNDDGLVELLIGSDWDVHGYDPVTSDIFVYDGVEIHSVIDSKFKSVDDDSNVYDPTIYKNNVICAGITTDSREETWFFKLSEDGKELETVDNIRVDAETSGKGKCEELKYYQSNKKITEQEYIQLKYQFKEYDPQFDEPEEDDIPYTVLIRKS